MFGADVKQAEAAWQNEVRGGRVFGTTSTPIYRTVRVGGKKRREVVEDVVPPMPDHLKPRIEDVRVKPNRNFASKTKAAAPKSEPKSASRIRRERRKRQKAREQVPDINASPRTFAEAVKKDNPVVQGNSRSTEHEHPLLHEKGARYCLEQGCPNF